MIQIIMLVLIGGGVFIFMKFYAPKMKEQMANSQKEFETEWAANKDQIIEEYISNTNKFGLIAQATNGEKVHGICNATLDKKSILSTGLEALKSAITLTSKVDMSLSYFVTTEKGLHYMEFDGEKCYTNEVFDYSEIKEKTFLNNNFNFTYKGDTLKFVVSKSMFGFPRFNVHERFREPTSNDRSKNYFVREFLAHENTRNSQFTSSEPGLSKYTKIQGLDIASKENLIDTEVRTHLLNEFKTKLSL